MLGPAARRERAEPEDSYGRGSIPVLGILQQQDTGSRLLPGSATTPSTRHGCSAKQKRGRVWHPGSGSRGERGRAGREQRVRADCASPARGLRFDRSAFLAEGIWLYNRFLERSGRIRGSAAQRKGWSFEKSLLTVKRVTSYNLNVLPR